MKTHTIKSIHATLQEALTACNYDVSYNPQHAAEKVKRVDQGFNHDGTFYQCVKAFVLDEVRYGNPVVMYVVKGKEGVHLLHTFSVSVSCIHAGDLYMCISHDEEMKLFQTAARFPKTPEGWAEMAEWSAKFPVSRLMFT